MIPRITIIFEKFVPNMIMLYSRSHFHGNTFACLEINTPGSWWDLKVIQDSGLCAVHVL